MSGNIKAKDLTYDSSLPPFLQRLHAQKAGHGDPDRHDSPVARPKKAKDPNDDDDDPIVVDGSGETLTKEEYQSLITSPVPANGSGNVAAEINPSTEPVAPGALPPASMVEDRKTQRAVTDGMTQQKRKAAKVVGTDADDEESKHASSTSTRAKKKQKRKPQPVKLAFGEDEAA